MSVAPVRERGLKHQYIISIDKSTSRSRKGAWIETVVLPVSLRSSVRRSRKGAWIETTPSKAKSNDC